MLAVLVACGVVAAAGQGRWTADADVMSLKEDGVGPMRLGRAFDEAERLAFRVAAESAFSGVGCGGLAEIRYEGRLGEQVVGIMAMTGGERIETVEVTLREPVGARTQAECLSLRDRFAEPFLSRYGAVDASWQSHKPVSVESLARTGPVLIESRWFPTGGDCYISARYGDPRIAAEPAGVSPGAASSSLPTI